MGSDGSAPLDRTAGARRHMGKKKRDRQGCRLSERGTGTFQTAAERLAMPSRSINVSTTIHLRNPGEVGVVQARPTSLNDSNCTTTSSEWGPRTGIAGEKLVHVSFRGDGDPLRVATAAATPRDAVTGRPRRRHRHRVRSRRLSRRDHRPDPDGDVTVRRWPTDLGRSMAQPLTGFVTVLNPDLLVVDSALGPAAEPVVDGLRTIERRAFPMTYHGLEARSSTASAPRSHAEL